MQAISIKAVYLHSVGLPLAEKLRTSYGAEPFKSAIIVQVETDDGIIGWGECPTKTQPSYGYETMATAGHIIREFLVPLVVGQTITTPTDVPKLLKTVRGHPMSKHGLESAIWDAWAQANHFTLAEAFAAHLPEGHTPLGRARVGVSIGIQPSIEKTLDIIQMRLDQGYERIKLKIEPGWDVELAQGVRRRFADITLMLDANSAYTLADTELLRQLDDFDLLMLEQPLGFTDIYEHSKLQPLLETPICMDESIHSANDVRLALSVGACRVINLKPARVSGYTESLEIYRVCVETQTPLWVGGLLETGIGRAANLMFASLPGVTLPSDISATDRYFEHDLTHPPFVLDAGSTIVTPDAPGIGVQVQPDVLADAEANWRARYPYQTPEHV